MIDFISNTLNIFHWCIYYLSFVALIIIIIYGNKYKIPLLYIGLLITIQSIYNGCPLTDIQSYFWVKQGLVAPENRLIISHIVSDAYIPMVRILMFAIGSFFIYSSSGDLLTKK